MTSDWVIMKTSVYNYHEWFLCGSVIYGVIFEGSNRSILVSNTKVFSASGQPKSVYMSTTFEVMFLGQP